MEKHPPTAKQRRRRNQRPRKSSVAKRRKTALAAVLRNKYVTVRYISKTNPNPEEITSIFPRRTVPFRYEACIPQQ